MNSPASKAQAVKIDIKQFSFAYGDHAILKQINLQFSSEEIHVLIGPSGCGKSTLLRSLNRMHDLYPGARYEGEILLLPDRLSILKADPIYVRLQIGMVFQKPNPFPRSIFENLTYGLKIRGITNKKIWQEKVENVLQMVSLWNEVKDRLHQPAQKLSGGQQQRLCLARALITEPEVLLLDEPTSALDPISSEKIEETLLSLKGKMTLILVTHNLRSAKNVGDTVTFLNHGQVIEQGLCADIFNSPQHPQTQKYLDTLS